MNNERITSTQSNAFKAFFIQALLIGIAAIITGSLVAFFLWSLDEVTKTRLNNLWLIFLLPIAGILIHFIYKWFGKNSAAGNNLIIDEIHEPGGGVPPQLTPLVLLSTLITHLFGGSAGREGTAVQMGGSIGAMLAKYFSITQQQRSLLLMCGMSAGFGAVFGTPVAGAIFAVEVLAIGKIKYAALLPCFAASLLAHYTCMAYGIHHTQYNIVFEQDVNTWLPYLSFDRWTLLKAIVAGAAFGIVGLLFSEAAHFMKELFNRFIKIDWLIPVCGGLLVIAISYALGTFDYLGLGVTNPNSGISIVAAFTNSGVTNWSWLWKLLLTVITLSSGFKGGEVTPLFFIGATLGNALAIASGAPVDLFAALGFIAVFAAATNTPFACIMMGIELFGAHHIIYFIAACFMAYFFSGHTGIYSSQRIGIAKYNRKKYDTSYTLKDARKNRR